MVIFRRARSASLRDTPKKLKKGEKRIAPSPPEDRFPKKGKGNTTSTYAAATRGKTPQKDGEWQLVKRRKGEKKKKKRKKGFHCFLAARSGDAIRVSAKDGESYLEILKAMKAKANP